MHFPPLNRAGGVLATVFTLIASAPAEPPGDSPRGPNLVFIMADDLGYGDLGCFGQTVVKTPHLDELAAGGMRYTDFYAGCTVCRPSRLALWTGKHMGHTPINSNASYVFKPSDVTVAELLRDAGYRTGGVGKWAMGQTGTGGHPNSNGFDFWFGYLDQGEAHNYYPTHLWRNDSRVPLAGNVLTGDPKDRGRVAAKRVTYAHDLITEEALDFVRRNKARPFLLHVHWTIPHANNEGGRATGDGMEVPDYGIYADEDWPSTKKGAAAMITRMDRDVGKLVALLRELEIDNRTLVFFTSDNGPHSEGGHTHETFDANGPLRGYKRNLYEGGIRVPGIAYWPGTVKAGTTCSDPFAFWDWLPTACDLAGTPTPDGSDGLSFAPTLLGQVADQQQHEYLYWGFGDKRALRKGRWKAVRENSKEDYELFDLDRDPGESKDLSSAHPELLAELERLVEEATR